jgi:hypothetical protein
MTISLDYAMTSDGTMEYRHEGVLVGSVDPRQTAHGFWVTMKLDGMPWSAMPCRSLEAAGYLILASYLEMRAVEAYDPADDAC